MKVVGLVLVLFCLAGCGAAPPVATSTASPSTSPSPENSPHQPADEPLSPNAWRAQQGKAAIKTLADQADLRGAAEVRNTFAPGSTPAAVRRGRDLYLKNCRQCHGGDGQPNPNLSLTAKFSPATLSEPTLYKFGADDKAIYRSIAHGVPTAPMGFYKGVLAEEQIWDITYFVMSLHK